MSARPKLRDSNQRELLRVFLTGAGGRASVLIALGVGLDLRRGVAGYGLVGIGRLTVAGHEHQGAGCGHDGREQAPGMSSAPITKGAARFVHPMMSATAFTQLHEGTS